MDQAVCQTVTRMYGRGALEARQEIQAPRGTPDMKSERREPAAAAVQTVGHVLKRATRFGPPPP